MPTNQDNVARRLRRTPDILDIVVDYVFGYSSNLSHIDAVNRQEFKELLDAHLWTANELHNALIHAASTGTVVYVILLTTIRHSVFYIE